MVEEGVGIGVLALGSVGFGSICWYWDAVGIGDVGIEVYVSEPRMHAHKVQVSGLCACTVLVSGEYKCVGVRSVCACVGIGSAWDGVV